MRICDTTFLKGKEEKWAERWNGIPGNQAIIFDL